MTTPVFTQAYDNELKKVSIQIVLPLDKDMSRWDSLTIVAHYGYLKLLEMFVPLINLKTLERGNIWKNEYLFIHSMV